LSLLVTSHSMSPFFQFETVVDKGETTQTFSLWWK